MASAQHGTVIYEERVRLEVDLPPAMQMMRGHVPTETMARRQLLFDGAISLLTVIPEEEEQLELREQRGFMFSFGGRQEDAETFVDRNAGVAVERREAFGRTFLITDSLATLPWRITGEQAQFLGYLTMQAVARTSDTTSVEAWFTPQIPAPAGPAGYGGLPGLVLMLSENGGSRSFVAHEVSLDAPDVALIRAPVQGRQTTRQEFEAVIEERMREMGIPARARSRYRTRGR